MLMGRNRNANGENIMTFTTVPGCSVIVPVMIIASISAVATINMSNAIADIASAHIKAPEPKVVCAVFFTTSLFVFAHVKLVTCRTKYRRSADATPEKRAHVALAKPTGHDGSP